MPNQNIKLPRYAVFAKPRTSSVALTQVMLRIWETKNNRKLSFDETFWSSGRAVQLYKEGTNNFFNEMPEGYPPFKLEACMVLPQHTRHLEAFVHNNDYIPIFIERDNLELLTSFYISSLSHFHDFHAFKSRNFMKPRIEGTREEEFFSWTIDERLERMKEIVNIVLTFCDRDKQMRKLFPNHIVLDHKDIKDDITKALPMLNIEVEEEMSFRLRVKKSVPFDIPTEERIALAEFAELIV